MSIATLSRCATEWRAKSGWKALVTVTEISGVGDGRESWAMISGWCRVKD